MDALSEETFRSLLDDHGTLRPSALRSFPVPDRDACFAVFSQDRDARLATSALKQNATRFFGAKIGATVDKSYVGAIDVDAARIVIATEDATTSGTRLCFGRPVTLADREAADEAERAQGTNGLADLARRCRMLWLIVPETHDDRVALTLAAVFATVMLGPILRVTSDRGAEIFGVRTARTKLEHTQTPYR